MPRRRLTATAVPLPAVPSSARAARTYVSAVVSAADLPDGVVESAALLTSEVVTNAIVHAGRDITVHAVVNEDACVRVEVSDAEPRLPAVQPTRIESTNGRGLVLVEALATTWGIDVKSVGKTVWFELQSEQASRNPPRPKSHRRRPNKRPRSA